MVDATAKITAIKTGNNLSRNAVSDAVDSGIPRFKVGFITLDDTVDDTDTTVIDVYEKFGITKILIVTGYIHTTTDSVIVEEEPVTAVTITNLTITVGGSTDNKKRFYIIYGI